MRIKKKLTKHLVLILAASQCMSSTSMAGWESNDLSTWKYQIEDGSYLSDKWFQEPETGLWYYLDQNGVMFYGWKQIQESWYFFQVEHHGQFGAMLVGWQWIDGYCYYFGHDGKMYEATKTPDGFTVDASGRWIENETAVYVAGKGINTTLAAPDIKPPARGGGQGSGGGSGGSGGGGGNAAYTYYDYTILHTDEQGTVLASETGQAKRNSFVFIEKWDFEGYEFVSGAAGSQKLTNNHMSFVLQYKKIPAGQENPDPEEIYSYSITYKNSETGEIIKQIKNSGKKDTIITIPDTVLAGYRPSPGNAYSFQLTEDHMNIELLFLPKQEEYSYQIDYMGLDGTRLGKIEGKGLHGSRITIPVREYHGYERIVEDDAFILDGANKNIKILYRKIDSNGEATPSEPQEEYLNYELKYIDKDSGRLISNESGRISAGSILIPDQQFEGYQYASDYTFMVTSNEQSFVVYLVKGESEESSAAVSYTVTCVDESGIVLKVYPGTITVSNEPVAIYPTYNIPGYRQMGENEFMVDKHEDNAFVLRYQKVKEYEYRIECVDIDTMETIETVTLYGDAGEQLFLGDLCPDEYRPVANAPQNVVVSGKPENNYQKIFFIKEKEEEIERKEVPFTVQFRAYKDHDTKLLNDLTGIWEVGESLPIYFFDIVTDAQGVQWKVIGDSPRVFKIRDQVENTFLIEFERIGDPGILDQKQSYSIRYIAEDTGSVLGVSVGSGLAGDIIPYQNSFSDYGFNGDIHSHTISKNAEDNRIDVILRRVNFPGHEKNPSTDRYDGFEWTALFVNSNGEQLFDHMSGFTVDGDDFSISYPDTIEKDGVIYRAKEKSPYTSVASGTTYRQYHIQYITGDSSESKLADWKNAAQQKKDAFFGITPYCYYMAYREKNSWNDIGLKLGVASADTSINIEGERFDGWVLPQESLGSFVLSEDKQKLVTQYERSDNASSIGYHKRKYTIQFIDSDGNELLDSYTGQLAFPKVNSTTEFMVYHPDFFYDVEGNRWEADVPSPHTFVMSALDKNEKSISYHLAFENAKEQFIVESNADINRILNDFATHTNDVDIHDFYVIGRDFNTQNAEVSDTVNKNNLAGYSNEVVDRFVLNGVSYTVSHISYYRKWDQSTCTHEWEHTEELAGNCLTASTSTVRCKKCHKEHTIISPAIGHIDENYDSICDTCGIRLNQRLGDEITVTWDSGELGFGKKHFDFVCIDENYKGTGKMLYISLDAITSDVYGSYTSAESADYGSSSLRYFLDDSFANGLSIAGGLNELDGDAVSILTQKEFESYRTGSINQYPFPTGAAITKSDNMDHVVLSNGKLVSKEQAAGYPVYPVVLMDHSDETGGTQTGVWAVGDMQARELGDKLYLFRCVNANYMDSTNSDRGLALFLCDSVILANEGLGFGENGSQISRFFGVNNNYKYSDVNAWLNDQKSRTGNLVTTNIGIVNEYSGKTEAGRFHQLESRSLTRYRRSTAQVMYSDLFIPSVEEALSMKEYLWKFNGSERNNASEVINNYCDSYWLRTPQYGTDDMVYTVNLITGVIEPKSVMATEDNELSNTGIRPMYLVKQAY